MFELHLFPARDGDALILTWGSADEPHRMMVDCGRESGWPQIRKEFEEVSGEKAVFDLLVVTHIDADHIAGVLKMLSDPKRPIRFREIWFNAYHHLVEGEWETFGPEQGDRLSDILVDAGERWNTSFGGAAVMVANDGGLPVIDTGGLRLTLLSPTRRKLVDLEREWKKWLDSEGLGRTKPPRERSDTARLVPEGYEAFGGTPDVAALAEVPDREDTSAANGSSIAFAAEYDGKRVLLAGDAHPSVLVEALERLPVAERRFDLVKLSHHGSKNNFGRRLFDLLDCDRYAVSTDGSRHGHPDHEMVAKLVSWSTSPTRVYFNYRSEETAIWDDPDLQRDYDYACVYPVDGKAGRLVIDI